MAVRCGGLPCCTNSCAFSTGWALCNLRQETVARKACADWLAADRSQPPVNPSPSPPPLPPPDGGAAAHDSALLQLHPVRRLLGLCPLPRLLHVRTGGAGRTLGCAQTRRPLLGAAGAELDPRDVACAAGALHGVHPWCCVRSLLEAAPPLPAYKRVAPYLPCRAAARTTTAGPSRPSTRGSTTLPSSASSSMRPRQRCRVLRYIGAPGWGAAAPRRARPSGHAPTFAPRRTR